MSLVLWVLFLACVLLALRLAAGHQRLSRPLKLLLFPGVFLAAGAKSLACWCARAPVQSMNLPWRAGEPVVHEPSPVPIFGAMLTAVVPVLTGLISVLSLRLFLDPGFQVPDDLPDVRLEAGAIWTFLTTSYEILRNAAFFPPEAFANPWKIVLFFYTSASVLIYTAPSARDWRTVVLTVAACAIPVALIDWLGLKPGFFSRASFLQKWYAPAVFEGLSVLIGTSWLVLQAVGLLRAGAALLRAAVFPAKSDAKEKGARKKGRAPARSGAR